MCRGVPILLLLAGCGDAPLMHAQMADLQKKLDDTQRRAAAADDKVKDLQDQVFLLTDKLESQKVVATHKTAPRLPVVLLKPDGEPHDAEGGDDIVFEGAARSTDPDHARPRLVLDGNSPAPPRTRPARAALPAQSSTENIGVAPAPPIARAKSDDARPKTDDPLKLYHQAYDALRAGRHDEAIAGFRELVRRFPEHDLADNAQYWLGECFYDRKLYSAAAPEFRQVVTRYPTGNKAPDALLKLAYCLLALGDLQKGRDLLSQVPASYPHTEAARLAELRLAEIGRTAGGTQ
jgi:tol-pal system protein YbgF